MSRSKSTSLEIETIHTLLSNATRRSVLEVLRTVERTTPEELGRRLASSDRDPEGDGSDSRVQRRITIELVHNHLPRLDAHDVVDYDGPDAAVTPGEHFDELEAFLEQIENRT